MPKGVYQRKNSKQKELPPLPTGIRLGIRPAGVEFMVRGDARWLTLIDYLKVLSNTATLQIDIAGCPAKKITSMKGSIRHAGKRLGVKETIKFVVQGDVLHIWKNGEVR